MTMDSGCVKSVYLSTVYGDTYAKQMEFSSRAELEACHSDIEEIKKSASGIQWDSLDVNKPQDRKCVTDWIGLCLETFGELWGWGRLPEDIRIQINACETKFLGVAATDLGEDVGRFDYDALRDSHLLS